MKAKNMGVTSIISEVVYLQIKVQRRDYDIYTYMYVCFGDAHVVFKINMSY